MKILLATDGSERALASARFLSSFPHDSSVHTHILTVLDTEDPSDGLDILSPTKAALGDFAGHITTAVARGNSTSDIVEAILWAADYLDADMIVLGASGHSAIARFFLGSIAEAIARYAEHPVLLTRPLKVVSQTVIIGLDGSTEGENAVQFATSTLPLPLNVNLHLVQVVPQNDKYPPEELERKQQSARDYVNTRAKELEKSGFGNVSTETPVGNPALELIRIAQEKEAKLIVVGSQGESGVDSFQLGSVAERVMRHAPCSILVVKQPSQSQILGDK